MKKIVLTLVTMLLVAMGSLVMAQGYAPGTHLTNTIVTKKYLSSDSTLWTGKEYKFYLPNYFKFVKQDSTFVTYHIQGVNCQTIDKLIGRDSLGKFIYKLTEVCESYDTIPDHWEVFDVIDSSVSPVYTLLGNTNLPKSIIEIKNNTILLSLKDTGTVDNQSGNILFEVKTKTDTVKINFFIAYITKLNVFKKTIVFQNEATVGEVFKFSVETTPEDSTIKIDPNAQIELELPFKMDSLAYGKNLRKSSDLGTNDVITTYYVDGSGIVPSDTTNLKITLKSCLLKSDVITKISTIKFKATVGGAILFDKDIPLKSGSETTTSITQIRNFQLENEDFVYVVNVGGIILYGDVYGSIKSHIRNDDLKGQIIFINCPKKGITIKKTY